MLNFDAPSLFQRSHSARELNEWWHFQQVEQRMMQRLVAFCAVMRAQNISLLHSNFFYFGVALWLEAKIHGKHQQKPNTILIYHALFGVHKMHNTLSIETVTDCRESTTQSKGKKKTASNV